MMSSADVAFTRELDSGMESDFTSMRQKIVSQVEEYLKRRTAELDSAFQAERQRLLDAHQDEMRVVEGSVLQLKLRLDRHRTQRSGCIDSLAQERAKALLKHWWSIWKSGAQRSILLKKAAVTLECSTNRATLQSRWATWRLWASKQTLQKRHEVYVQSRERKLRAELNAAKAALSSLERKRSEVDEQTKEAFVRGVCALNREAVQVLHVGQTGDDETEAIESILRGTPSTSSHHAPLAAKELPPSDSSRFSSSCATGRVCPVHHVDEDGVFYHKCYSSRAPHAAAAQSTSAHRSFVIRVDPNDGVPIGGGWTRKP